MGDIESTKKRFYKEVEKLISKKAHNNQLFSKDAYYSLLANVKASKNKKKNKKPEDYRRLLRYDTVEIGNVQKLVVPIKNERDPIIYYTYLEEVFDIIHISHLSLGHGGRNRMMAELKNKYKNITKELINTYLNLCELCQKKMSIPKKGLVVKPIESNEFNSRCQVDLIDMQSQADGDYKFIMVYQDHLTKFVQLRALKTKIAEEVAYHLLEVFTIFGAPCILHSDNGREFAKEVIVELCLMWDEPKIVHGKPRHSQSQGSVERANQDIEKMLATWLATNKTTKWSEGIKIIQFMKNKAYHSGISRSPHEAMFGCKAKVGLKTFLPALETMSDITSEEDLEAMVKKQNGQASEDIDTNSEGSINNDTHSEITIQQAITELGPSDREESITTNQLKENDDGNNVKKGEAVRSKWKTIRDGYTKYKKQLKATTAYKRTNVTYTWAPQLSFLDDYNVGLRPSHSKTYLEASQSAPDSDQSQDTPSPLSSTFPSQTPMTQVSTRSNKRQSSDHMPEDDEEQILKTKKRKELDVVDNLFLSYADTFKKFPAREQAIVKLELAKLFSNTELQLLNDQTNESNFYEPTISKIKQELEEDSP